MLKSRGFTEDRKADVVSNIALVVAIISLLSAGAFLLIVIKTDEVSKLLMNVPYLLASAGLFFSIISLLFEWKARKRSYTSANDVDEK